MQQTDYHIEGKTEGNATTERSERSLLVAVSGSSGAGKNTLIRELLHQYPNYRLSVSTATRAPHAGKEDEKGYFFVSHEHFGEMIAGHKFIEYASYVGGYYGAPKDYIEEMLAAGNDVILEIEVQGALKIKDIFPETVFVFVTPPGTETLGQRLTGCGTESHEQTLARLEWAAEESRWMSDYDYLLVDDNFSETATRLHALLESQHLGIRCHRAFAEEIRVTLNHFYLKEEK